jgi:hypothetical protein
MLREIVIFLLVFIFIKSYGTNDKFDGVGKSFGKYYKPNPDCLKKKNCYKGSYIGIDHYDDTCMPNNLFKHPKYMFLCDVNKHLQRKCFWKRVQ